MPVGYSARCRVCNSAYRTEIEKWCKEESLSPRAASARLLEQYQEKISHKSIWGHMQEHFDVRAEAREQYHRSQAQMQHLAEKRVSDIEMLDEIAAGSFELNLAARAWLQELVDQRYPKIPKALVDLVSVTAAEVRQHMKTKQELLGDDPMSRLADGVATWAELVEASAVDDDG